MYVTGNTDGGMCMSVGEGGTKVILQKSLLSTDISLVA